MSNNSTIFISGFSLGVNEKDKVIVLGLIDGMVPDSETTYNFALPKTVFKNLLNNLTDIDKSFDSETASSDNDLEE